MPWSSRTGSYGRFIFRMLSYPHWLPKWLDQFSILPTVNGGSFFNISSPALVGSSLADCCHSDGGKMKSKTCVDLHRLSSRNRNLLFELLLNRVLETSLNNIGHCCCFWLCPGIEDKSYCWGHHVLWTQESKDSRCVWSKNLFYGD